MKMIIAIIRPEKLDSVKDALASAGFSKMTVLNVLGRGAQGGINFISRGQAYTVELIEKVEIQIVAFDEKVEKIVQIILKHAKTNKGIGDGKVFITPCEHSFQISSGNEMIDPSKK